MKVPTARKLPSGRWFVRLRLDGTEYAQTFATEREAVQWATLIKAQHKAGVLRKKLPAEDKTISRLIDEYIEENTLAENTVHVYRLAQKHFTAIMHKPYSQIRNWQKAITMECEQISPNSVKHLWQCCSAAMHYAGLEVPNVVIKTVPYARKAYLNEQEIRQFCEHIKGSPYEPWLLMMLSSMRISEALSVRNEDISDKGIHVRGTKTAASDRIVPWMIPRLRELCDAGLPHPPHDRTIRRCLDRISEEMSLPHLSPHCLRVSFVSICFHKNVPEHVVMRIGGWTSAEIVHRHYLRIYEDDVEAWAKEVSGVFV